MHVTSSQTTVKQPPGRQLTAGLAHRNAQGKHSMEKAMAEKEKKFSFGGAHYERQSPPRENASRETQILNIEMTLAEALKLGLAMDECCRKVNRYNMATSAGKRARVCLAVHFEPQRIVAYEGKGKKIGA